VVFQVQPAIVDGKLTQGKDTEAICGHQMGGKSKGHKGSKGHNDSKERKSSKKGIKGKKGGKGKTTKKAYKGSKGKKGDKMTGGSPGKYPFEGENSNFSDDATGKDFAGKQPYWSPETR
jgi:hypothetical protein